MKSTVIFSKKLATEQWGKEFDESLTAACLQKLNEHSPREIKRILRSAAGNAVAHRSEAPYRLIPSDIQSRQTKNQKRRIGF